MQHVPCRKLYILYIETNLERRYYILCIEANKTRFLSILREKVNRPGLDELIGWMEGNDFFTAPASTRFHGNYDGGLCEHSLNVYDCLMNMISRYPDVQVSEESAALCSLTHDLCKANFYKKEWRNRKNDNGQWERYMAYGIDELFPGGHGEKSAFIVQQFMKLLPEEFLAIRWHMGMASCGPNGDNRSLNAAFDKYKLAAMVHLADMEASHMIERTVQY